MAICGEGHKFPIRTRFGISLSALSKRTTLVSLSTLGKEYNGASLSWQHLDDLDTYNHELTAYGYGVNFTLHSSQVTSLCSADPCNQYTRRPKLATWDLKCLSGDQRSRSVC